MIYAFGAYLLDTDRLELWGDQEPVAVEPQVFGVLHFLIENRDRVVSKEDLIEHIWHGRFIADATLSARISAARRAVGDNGKDQAVIRTIARRGFRFVADVQVDPVDELETKDPDSSRSGKSESLSLPDKPSIVVLPFQNLSRDPEQDFFADGMTEDIITGLSRFRSLFVIARNTSFAHKDTPLDVRKFAHDLGVRYVLEGSVRQGGNRIRITVQLIDAETGNHVWAERYDRDREDIFVIQDEVTDAIVAAIAPEIDEVERHRAERKPPENFDTWGLYQRGTTAYYSSTGEGHETAMALFDRVNEIDPTFAPAFALAASVRTRYVMQFMPANRRELLNVAREKAHIAITLDPRDSLCLMIDGRVQSLFGHHDVAISKCEEAVDLNPNNALAHYLLAAVLCSAGRAEDAIPHVDEAMRLSPRDLYLTSMVFHRALMLFHIERYEEAFEWARRASLSAQPRPLVFALLAAVSTKLGRKEETRVALEQLLILAPEVSCAQFADNPMFGGPKALKRFITLLQKAGLPT